MLSEIRQKDKYTNTHCRRALTRGVYKTQTHRDRGEKEVAGAGGRPRGWGAAKGPNPVLRDEQGLSI